MKETLEEAAEFWANEASWCCPVSFEAGATWQQERSQKIVPFDAVDIEVFAIKPDEDGKLFAYIGYKIANENFEFNVVPFTEPQAERRYSEEDLKAAWIHGAIRSPEEFKHLNNFDVWLQHFKKK